MARVCTSCQREYDSAGLETCPEDGTLLRPVLSDYTGAAADVVGRVLDGRYLVEEVLGEGGMGVVLAANHVFLQRKVAIKILHPELLIIKETRIRFVREARTASKVRHPHVVEITDFGVTAKGIHYLVMEFLQGSDLLGYQRDFIAPDARFAARIGIQVCEALAAIHEHGIIHRDLKPENIWVLTGHERDGAPHVKLLDFGIAGLVAGDLTDEQTRLTQTGRTLGTAHYMAPEQARGGAIDGRVDLYALGCVLWEFVAGRPAFTGTSPADIMMKQLNEHAPPPSSINPLVPAWFDRVVLKALAKDRDHRFPDAAAMKVALEEGLAEHQDTGEERAVARARKAETLDRRDDRTYMADAFPGPQPRATGEGPMTPSFVERVEPPAEEPEAESRGWKGFVFAGVAVAALLAAIVMLTPSPDPATTSEAPPVEPVATPEARPSNPSAGPAAEVATAPIAAEPAAVSKAPPAQADPPPAASEPVPVAAVAPSVVLQFHVKPDGTEVVRDGKVLGTTPLALAVDRSDEKVRYTFRHEGRTSMDLALSHDRDRVVPLELAVAGGGAGKNGAEPADLAAKKPKPSETKKAKPEVEPGTELMRPARPGAP